jgi:hypothetical protein
MGVRILFDRDHDIAALYCSTTGVAFGPTFHSCADGYTVDAHDVAWQFLEWLQSYEPTLNEIRWGSGFGGDPRRLTDAGLLSAYAKWLVVTKRGS